MAIDGTWASPLPHAVSATAFLTKGWRGLHFPSLLSIDLLQIPFLAPSFRRLQIRPDPPSSMPPMAPKKARATPSSSWYEPTLDTPSVSEENLAAMLLMTAEGDKKRKTMLRVGSAEPADSGSTFYPFFTSSIVAGLVPPFSDFFYSAISHYKIHALHLHPNFVLLLSIFTFYYEAYVGEMSSVALLCHFFLRLKEGPCSGCVGFVAANKITAILKAGKKAEGFRSKWVLMDAKHLHPGCCCQRRLLCPRRDGFAQSSLTRR